MSTQLLNDSIKSIGILRALHLGDMLCTVPALRALRRHFPSARIALIGLSWARDFVARFHQYLDEFIEFPGFPGLPEQAVEPAAIARFLLDTQARRFDLVLQMQGNGRYANPCIGLWGARLSAGFCLPHQYTAHPELYLPYPRHLPEVHRHLRLMRLLGVDGDMHDDLEFPLTAADREDFAQLVAQHGSLAALLDGRFVCIHPGGHSAARRWSIEGFAEVADALAARHLSIVLTGTNGERRLTRRLALAMQRPAIDLAGRTSLGMLGVLFKRARMLVSNSTGVAHLASALNLPSIVIFRNCDPQRWGPLDRSRHRRYRSDRTTVESIVAGADTLLATTAEA